MAQCSAFLQLPMLRLVFWPAIREALPMLMVCFSFGYETLEGEIQDPHLFAVSSCADSCRQLQNVGPPLSRHRFNIIETWLCHRLRHH